MDHHHMSDSSARDEDLFIPVEADSEDPVSDVSSVLSDLPTDWDLLDHGVEDEIPGRFQEQCVDGAPSEGSESEQVEESDVYLESEYEDVVSDDSHPTSNSEVDWSISFERLFDLKIESTVSKFEKLPYEVLQRIAILLPSDSDLGSLILTCHTFARQLQPENSLIWKARCLLQYDHPIVEGPFEFRIVYQLRAMLLPRFHILGFNKDKEAKILLEVLREMVLETYNTSFPWHDIPASSKNMAAFSDAMSSAWMVHFLSTPLFGQDADRPYGSEHSLFDCLQVMFSYLVLSWSPMAFQVGRERSDYDLQIVYIYDQPCGMLYTRLSNEEQESSPQPPFPQRLFPNLQSSSPVPSIRFGLDMHTLLHIRNFWHRHLIEKKVMGGEETYAAMATGLGQLGISPRPWGQRLQDPIKIHRRWYGHYSCVYPWPKTSKLLRDKESEAEVWDNIDPLCLDFSTSTTNDDGAWPDIFADVPAFEKTLVFSESAPQHGMPTYLRGLAPFTAIDHVRNPPAQHTLSQRMYHPFTRLRLRGVFHSIADQADIPGWHRIVFVLYKPTYRALCEVFDHATEWYGEPFQQQLNNILGQNLANMSHEEIEAQYREHLREQLEQLKGPVCMDREIIERVEDGYSDPASLRWDDIEFAYAYEGILTPGGKVMLGRWWRLAPPGPLTLGDTQEYGNMATGYERGPFVFWSTE